MDAGRPKSMIDELQSLSGVEDDSFKDFIQEILHGAGSSEEEMTLETLREALAYYLQKEMGDVADTSH